MSFDHIHIYLHNATAVGWTGARRAVVKRRECTGNQFVIAIETGARGRTGAGFGNDTKLIGSHRDEQIEGVSAAKMQFSQANHVHTFHLASSPAACV